jgi:hypothetical protein
MPSNTTPKPFVFVLMPFDKKFKNIYKSGIVVACRLAGAYCERVDEQIFHESILERIYNQIAKADIIIADMTGRNPNVFYETGYAHALGKRVILLTEQADDIPFDLKHYTHIVHEGEIEKLVKDLKPRIRYFIDNPETSSRTSLSDLEVYLQGMKLEPGVNVKVKTDSFIDKIYEFIQSFSKKSEENQKRIVVEDDVRPRRKGLLILPDELRVEASDNPDQRASSGNPIFNKSLSDFGMDMLPKGISFDIHNASDSVVDVQSMQFGFVFPDTIGIPSPVFSKILPFIPFLPGSQNDMTSYAQIDDNHYMCYFYINVTNGKFPPKSWYQQSISFIKNIKTTNINHDCEFRLYTDISLVQIPFTITLISQPDNDIVI